MDDYLKTKSIIPIDVKVGEEFDPLHHSMINEGKKGYQATVITKVEKRGYRIIKDTGEIILRKPEVEVEWVMTNPPPDREIVKDIPKKEPIKETESQKTQESVESLEKKESLQNTTLRDQEKKSEK
jgi:hypothetical protein